MIHYDTIKKYADKFNNRTQHPLISLVNFNQSKSLLREKFTLSFYAIIIKETNCGDLRYGNQYYDYAEGTMVFFGPEHIITNEPEGEPHQPYGKALVFHPDLKTVNYLVLILPGGFRGRFLAVADTNTTH